ncbi:MAG: CoA-binding protein [Bacillota bacterium]|jgi:predicted CoA-binding protein
MNLKKARTIAVVGLSSNPNKASYQVAKYLKENGYEIFPINPQETEILGEKSYPDLLSLPEHVSIDIVNIFRRPEVVAAVVDQAIQKGAKMIWMQEGIVNEEAKEKALKFGLEVIMDSCIMKVHQSQFRRD